MHLLTGIAAVVVGFASGVLSGMFGVGGAVLTTPGIRVLGATPIEAVGSTIPAILPGAAWGAWRYARQGLVDLRVALLCGLVGSCMAVLGGEISDHVDAHYLMLLTAALLLWTGARNLRAIRAADRVPAAVGAPVVEGASAEVEPGAAGVALVGAAAGLLAGLLGVGGGILLVPGFTTILKMAPKRAVATSLVAVAIFSVPAMITHALLGHIHWGFALCLVVGVVPGAQIGSHITIRGSDRRLQVLMGCFFSVLAVAYGLGELRSLLA